MYKCGTPLEFYALVRAALIKKLLVGGIVVGGALAVDDGLSPPNEKQYEMYVQAWDTFGNFCISRDCI